ncbi:6146_t:CDS:1, partial [Funneliformis caledonium]
IKAIGYENIFDYPNKVLLTKEINEDFNFEGRVIHFANDLTAI